MAERFGAVAVNRGRQDPLAVVRCACEWAEEGRPGKLLQAGGFSVLSTSLAAAAGELQGAVVLMLSWRL
jgi:hypothetical protein